MNLLCKSDNANDVIKVVNKVLLYWKTLYHSIFIHHCVIIIIFVIFIIIQLLLLVLSGLGTIQSMVWHSLMTLVLNWKSSQCSQTSWNHSLPRSPNWRTNSYVWRTAITSIHPIELTHRRQPLSYLVVVCNLSLNFLLFQRRDLTSNSDPTRTSIHSL